MPIQKPRVRVTRWRMSVTRVYCPGWISRIGMEGLNTTGPGAWLESHPANRTAAIVVSRSCFISFQLSILHPSCRHVVRGGCDFDCPHHFAKAAEGCTEANVLLKRSMPVAAGVQGLLPALPTVAGPPVKFLHQTGNRPNTHFSPVLEFFPLPIHPGD